MAKLIDNQLGNFLQNLKWFDEPRAQFPLLTKFYAFLEWEYLQKHMISNIKV